MPPCRLPSPIWPPGTVIERVLNQSPPADRGWLLAAIEQHFRRVGDLAGLREIKAYRDRRRGDAPGPGKPPQAP